MNSQQPTLSIVIVAYKSNYYIDRCLESILKYNDILNQVEVIVVDNYPFESESFSQVHEKYPYVKVIKNPKNGGFGQGNNLGVEASSGRYLAFLNPDTQIIEPIFSFVVNQFESNINLAAFGMTLCDENGRKDQKSFGLFPELESNTRWLAYRWLINYLNFVPKGIYPWGANIFIRRDVFNRIGRFDERFFLCFEEPDLFRRIPKDYKVNLYKKNIVHSVGHSLKNEPISSRTKWYLDSEQYYFEKYKLNYKHYAKSKLMKLNFSIFIKKILGKAIPAQVLLTINHYKNIANS